MPGCAVRGENAMAEERNKGLFPAGSKPPFLEVQCQDGLDVFRLDGLHEVGEEELRMRSVSVSQSSSSVVRHQPMLLDSFDVLHDRLDTDYIVGERIYFRKVLHGLAAMLFNHGTARCANG